MNGLKNRGKSPPFRALRGASIETIFPSQYLCFALNFLGEVYSRLYHIRMVEAQLPMELDNIKKQFEPAKVDVERPFPQEEEWKAKTDRLNELNALLNVDKRENEIVGGEPDEGDKPPEKKPRDLER